MTDTATKLPVKTDKSSAPSTSVSGPWAPFETLRHEMERLFDRFGGGRSRTMLARPTFDFDLSWPREMAFGTVPAVDIAERETEYEITAELPGLDEKDVEVKLANGALMIKGEKKEEKEEKEKDYYLSERRYGSFTRSFRVPDGVDADKIAASFTKGVLTVKLPKTAEAQSKEKKIAVTAA
ncbi:Hsp20/alpha crystallin family protein [Aurantimonas marianensis]|uniref:Hsp20/alpha crystallin family protein n=1 Tax=Aurantimonas marianensis TaxID=2920428 RepID=A0A9X2HHI6_9HYPH|nr:Hsp20/alpha crystallin family protein [Aurantimonas marianensis]MCP3057089.1 Hsp20/alpha crystallin family protein [Aurantimonas marianensis]